MATSKTLNVTNLEALGAPRLAQLLIEISKGDAAAQRRLRLALAGSAGAAPAAREIGKRLAAIDRARTWLDWQKVRALETELDAQRQAILELVAPADPREAFELTWRLAGCAETVFARTDDGSGRLSAAFHAAVADLGPLAQRAAIDPIDLAGRAFRALSTGQYNTWDHLVATLAPQLGPAGLTALRDTVQAWQAEPAGTPPAKERKVIGWASGRGAIHADEIEASHRKHTSAFVLRQLADALGDVDAFIGQFDPHARTMPGPAADIARRLLGVGRPQDALAALDAVEPRHRSHPPREWDDARLDALDALGRADDAQTFRWSRFETRLDATHLRAFLKKLPDFDDFDAEQRALAHALAFREPHQALVFLVTWPDLARASQLVLARAGKLDGNLYELLSPAADALDDKYPLAATMLRRAMIDDTLRGSKSSRYKHSARHLVDCQAAATRIPEFGTVPGHDAYERALRAAHGRKAAFWQAMDALRSP